MARLRTPTQRRLAGIALLLLTGLAGPVAPHAADRPVLDPFSLEYRTATVGDAVAAAAHVRSFRRLIAYSLDQIHPDWLRSAGKGRTLAELRRLNEHINAVPYREEFDDIWWPPDVLLRTGGDCEDQAIAKYATLRKAGVPAAKLMILIVERHGGTGLHVLLGVAPEEPGGATLLLDNAAAKPTRLSRQSGLHLIAGLSESGWWVYSRKRRDGRAVRVTPRFEKAFCE